MQNIRLDESQAGIKIAGRNMNNLRYKDDTTLKAESEEDLKGTLKRKVKRWFKTHRLKLRSWHSVPSFYGK